MSDIATFARNLINIRERLFRYAAVSAVAVVVGQGLLVYFYEILDWGPVRANVVAVSIGAIPAYLLNRYWVWNKTSKNLFWTEIAPFWVLTLIGLGLSILTVAIVSSWTDKTIFIVAASLSAYGAVWVFKFFIFEHIMFGPQTAAASETK